ncbi:hypothetical protein AB0D12_31520 [Streptomyces sp. NPDC048479]|uniref:hypothetical protein n=1 Tax=Streptomyces sp. NPDC048479 TaxID=3154725 RepID=UPI00342607D0
MPPATEAPASITAEGPTSHTQNQNAEDLVSRLERLLEQAPKPAGTYGYTRAEQIASLHKLREPFDQREVRYKPQPWCKACSAKKTWPKVCDRHTEIKCQRCNGQKVTEAHICLKYIGHAEATNRLLNTDPFWDWEPLALDQLGLPQYDGNRGMWIRLTVCGVTRIGYGDATGKDGANAVKEIIGDALRNAGMRFGMALNLWTSSDLQILEPGVELAPELAAELGGPTRERKTDNQPAAKSSPAAVPAASGKDDSTAAPHLDRLMGQTQRCWDKPLALEQVMADAEKHAVIDEQVQDPFGNWLPFRTLLTVRIAELKQAPQGGHTERSAA